MAAGPPANGERHFGEPVESDAVFSAAVELVTFGSASFKRTARRFSLCTHDAEDAYQRSLEILLTKAPTARRDELRPWLHTVIKHEALALRRQRERSVSGEDDAAGADAVPAPDRGPDEAATGRERVHRTAEALTTLKPGEMQCLILKALGYSYDEITARTGFSWTKVNRSLTEGRRRFFERFGEIASGTACREYQPLLSAVCDGHVGEEDRRLLRTHLAGCNACRAMLREYRSAPARLAELLPPAVVLPLLDRAGLWSRMNDWFVTTAGERATAIGMKLQQGAEVVSAQKAAAVVASTAAIAGGGAAVQHADRAGHDRGPRAETTNTTSAPAVPAAEPQRTGLSAGAGAAVAQAANAAAVQARRDAAAKSGPDEFGFEQSGPDRGDAVPQPEATHMVSAAAASSRPQSEFAPVQTASGSRTSGPGEFGP